MNITAYQILLGAGLTLKGGQIFRDIDEQNSLETLDLLDVLRQGFANQELRGNHLNDFLNIYINKGGRKAPRLFESNKIIT